MGATLSGSQGLPSPEQTATAEVVPKSVAGSSFLVASSTLLPFDVQVPQDYCWYSIFLPVSRVAVSTGRYVGPAGRVIYIVSPGRLSLVPTDRVLSPGRVK
ncbi:hypothetical protein Tco_0765279 [Tanacetum coccineum]